MRANTSTIGILLTTVSLVGLGAGMPASAQQVTPLETIEVVPGDGVAGDEDAPGALAETPIAGDVNLSIEDIETWQPQDLKQLFMTTPSVTVAGGSAASQKFYVHGIDQSKLNVQIDGVRQKNNVWHHNGNIGLDPMFLKQVSVDAGVAPADWGPGALGGSVQFETVDARDLLEPGRTVGGMARLGYDTNSRSFKGTGAGYGLSEGFEVFAALSHEEGDDYENGDGLTEIGTAADMWNGLGKVAYQSQEGHRIAFSGEYFRDYRRAGVFWRPGLPAARQAPTAETQFERYLTSPSLQTCWRLSGMQENPEVCEAEELARCIAAPREQADRCLPSRHTLFHGDGVSARKRIRLRLEASQRDRRLGVPCRTLHAPLGGIVDLDWVIGDLPKG